MIYNLDGDTPVQFDLIEDIQQILKIKIEGKNSPLKFFIHYAENPVVKTVAAYISYDKKDPTKSTTHQEM